MELTTNELRENYARFSDEKLIQIATQKASVLPPEAVGVLKEELIKRKLPNEYLTQVEVQARILTDAEQVFYYTLIEKLPCPVCDSISCLNLAEINRVSSFLVFSRRSWVTKIACTQCLHIELNNATTHTMFFGWWSPAGIFNTIDSILCNLSAGRKLKKRHPGFENFIRKNIYLIEMYKDDPATLRQMLQQVHMEEH